MNTSRTDSAEVFGMNCDTFDSLEFFLKHENSTLSLELNDLQSHKYIGRLQIHYRMMEELSENFRTFGIVHTDGFLVVSEKLYTAIIV